MFSLKKSCIVFLGVSSTLAYAGAMGPVSCVKENLTLACECPGWTLAGRALYLKTNASIYNNAGNLSITPFAYDSDLSVNPGWSWGFQLEAGYHYTASNDINVNWYHFRQSGSKSIPGAVVGAAYVANNLYDQIIVDPGQFTINPQWDQVNTELGKSFELGEQDTIRAHGGFNYSRVANSGIEIYGGTNTISLGQGSTLVQSDNRNENYGMTFNGFGIRTGLDLTHSLTNSFSIYATGAASLLAGSSKSSSNGVSLATADNTSKSFSNNNYNSRSLVVPELDGKAGINYIYCLNQGRLIADAGWLWANYFNALDDSVSLTNFGIQGLYFGLKYQGHLI